MRVVIIGAGIAGTTLAVFLSRQGIVCELYERAPKSGGGAALAIAANGLAVLDAAGVLDALDAGTTKTHEWAFESQSGSVLACIADARRQTPLQTRMISRPILQRVMEEALAKAGVQIHYGKTLQSVIDGPGQPVVACFEDGTHAEGDCLVGADGIGSRVRQSIFPDAPKPEYTGLMAPVGFSPCLPGASVTAASQQRVHLIFGKESFFEWVNVMTPDGPKAVWWSTSETPLVGRAVMAEQTLADHRARLLALHAGWAEPVPRLIETAESIVPIAVHGFPHLRQWSAGRAIVIGDAAHAVGPHSGQASSMALEDALALANSMRGASVETVPDLFHRFADHRQGRIDRVMEIGTRAAKRKEVISPLKFWVLQQMMRVRVPLGSMKNKGWLLDHRVTSEAAAFVAGRRQEQTQNL